MEVQIMKLQKNFLFLMMVLMIAGAALAGCGSDTESDSVGSGTENSGESSSSTTESEDGVDETESSSSNYTSDFSLSETDEQEVTVGKVVSIETDSMMFSIYESESEEEIEDYASVDMSSYTATLQQETYTLDGSERIYIVNEGVLEAASVNDISEGDMIISYTDENEMPAIVIYPAE